MSFIHSHGCADLVAVKDSIQMFISDGEIPHCLNMNGTTFLYSQPQEGTHEERITYLNKCRQEACVRHYLELLLNDLSTVRPELSLLVYFAIAGQPHPLSGPGSQMRVLSLSPLRTTGIGG